MGDVWRCWKSDLAIYPGERTWSWQTDRIHSHIDELKESDRQQGDIQIEGPHGRMSTGWNMEAERLISGALKDD